MQFWALNILNLTEETATKLDTTFKACPGVRAFNISVEQQQFCLVFDETRLQFDQIVHAITKAGCPLYLISAAVVC